MEETHRVALFLQLRTPYFITYHPMGYPATYATTALSVNSATTPPRCSLSGSGAPGHQPPSRLRITRRLRVQSLSRAKRHKR